MDKKREQLLVQLGFSDKAISVLDSKANMGPMEKPTVNEQHQGICGDILVLSLEVKDQQIKDASYEFIGCAGLQACASAMTELVKGKTVDEAEKLEVEDILEYLQGIPEQKHECAEIARDTLKKALRNL